MPRKPVSNVEGVRIDLGQKERDLLEELAASYRLKAILPQIAEIVTDASAMYALGVIYEVVTGKDLPFIISPDDSAAEMFESARNFFLTERQNRELESAYDEGTRTGVQLLQFLFGLPLRFTDPFDDGSGLT